MPILSDPRRETFAQIMASGKVKQTDAYVQAGYARDDGHAARCAARPDVAERIAELRAEVVERVLIDQAYVLSTIYDTVERCKQAVPVLDRKGQPVLVETPDGDIVPAYMFDPRSVLKGAELLGKHLGTFKEDQAPPAQVNIVMPDAELARLIAFQLQKAAKVG
jgi:phage terminase small subunit